MALAPANDEYTPRIGMVKKMKTVGMVPKGINLAKFLVVQTAVPTKAMGIERNWRTPPTSRWATQICDSSQDTPQLRAAELRDCSGSEGLI